MIKDYYQVLQLSPGATRDEIKMAYRKMAKLYHPDKNADNKYALAHFNLVKEAYETLSTPGLREKYLQQRWLLKSNGLQFDKVEDTPDSILQQFIATHKKVATLDEHRVDKKTMAAEMMTLLGPQVMNTLNNFNDYIINDQIIHIAVENAHILRAKDQLQIIQQIGFLNTTAEQKNYLTKKEKEIRRAVLWDKYKLVFIFLAVVILCTIIALST